MQDLRGYCLVPDFRMFVELDLEFKKPLDSFSYAADSHGIGAFLERWSTFEVSMQLLLPRSLDGKRHVADDKQFRRFANKNDTLRTFIYENWRDLLIPHESNHGLVIRDICHVINRGDPEYIDRHAIHFVDVDDDEARYLQSFALTSVCPDELKRLTMLRTKTPVLILDAAGKTAENNVADPEKVGHSLMKSVEEPSSVVDESGVNAEKNAGKETGKDTRKDVGKDAGNNAGKDAIVTTDTTIPSKTSQSTERLGAGRTSAFANTVASLRAEPY